MSEPTSLPRQLGLAAFLGVLVAAFYLHFFGGVVPSTLAAVVGAATLVLLQRLFPTGAGLFVVLGAISGAVAGVVWWALTQSEVSLLIASTAGAALFLVAAFCELVLPKLWVRNP